LECLDRVEIDIQLVELVPCLLRHLFQLMAFSIVADSQRCTDAASSSSTANSMNILGQLSR
jgi:hypothetical protein